MTPCRFMTSRRRARPAAGITLVEVIFAIGVVLIGLVGLASILPLAGSQAQDSLDFDVAAVLSNTASIELQTRRLLREPAEPAQRPIVRLDGNDLILNRNSSDRVIVPFCLDPVFAADQPTFETTTGYFTQAFPYFTDDHNPLINPARQDSEGFQAVANQPRMFRVGLRNPGLSAPRQLEIARFLTQSRDDLLQLQPDDRSIAPVIGGLTATASGLPFGGRIPTGLYSWFATVDPDESSRFASLSIVIVRSREIPDAFPTLFTEDDSEFDARTNAVSERLAIVDRASGFQGGAGGQVTLYSTATTLNRIVTNDWIMLSRSLDGSQNPQQHVHRWFRVVSIDEEAEFFDDRDDPLLAGGSVPFNQLLPGGRQIWARTMLLAGSDWNFDSTGSPPPGPVNNQFTYATIVDNVVAVNTQLISLADFAD